MELTNRIRPTTADHKQRIIRWVRTSETGRPFGAMFGANLDIFDETDMDSAKLALTELVEEGVLELDHGRYSVGPNYYDHSRAEG